MANGRLYMIYIVLKDILFIQASAFPKVIFFISGIIQDGGKNSEN